MRHFARKPQLKYTPNRPLPLLVTTDLGEKMWLVVSLRLSMKTFLILLLLMP